jgi:hypothetical protein
MTERGAHHVPKDRQEPTADEFGIGQLENGKLAVLTPEEYIQARADRDAEEAPEGDDLMPEHDEDFADLLEGGGEPGNDED